MKNPCYQQALELTRHLIRCHYCQQKSEELIQHFSPKISCFGAGENECAYNYQEIKAFFKINSDKMPSCMIEEEEFHLVYTLGTFCLVAGRYYIRTKDESQMMLREHQRVSFAYEWEDDQWKIVHIHTSNPYGGPDEEDPFPAHTGRETYEYFQQQLAEKTQQMKTALHELELEQERYRVALGNISDKIFEYDASTDICYIYEKGGGEIPTKREYDHFLDRLQHSEFLQANDYAKLKRAYENDQTADLQLQIDTEHGFQWISVQFRTLFDDSGRPCRSIGTIRDITEDVKANRELIKKAELDALTSIYNQETFKDKINAILDRRTEQKTSALLLLDLDDFKHVNDLMGHLFGNAVLIRVANCLKKNCQDSDIPGRIGGDEFAVFLQDTDHAKAEQTAAKIIADIVSIFGCKEERLTISCSIGIRLAEPESAESYESLFIAADQALYHVKNQGKNNYCFYKDLSEAEVQDNLGYSETKAFQTDRVQEKHQSAKDQLSAIALEILSRSDSLEVASHLLMEVVGNQFDLSRIAIIPSRNPKKMSEIQYQWTDRTTALLPSSQPHLTAEDYSRFNKSFDDRGICVIHADQFDGYSEEAREIILQNDAKTILYAAMRTKDRYSGTISFADCANKRFWTDEEKSALSEVSRIIATHLDCDAALRTASWEVEYIKSFDSLTGLSSLDRMKKECQKLMDKGDQQYAVIYSDIKDFKFVNETIGYTLGDGILRAFAKTLANMATAQSRCTRANGDHFIAFVPCGKSRQPLIDQARRVNDEFCRRQNLLHDNLNFRIRSGIYFIDSDCQEISAAIDRANMARQSIHDMQASEVVVYNEAIAQKISQEKRLIHRMEYALEHGEFQVYLQSLVSLKTREIIGAEALVRWHTPWGEVLSPDQFIPLFEKNGFVTKLDAFVLSSLCRKLHQLRQKGEKSVPVSTNISCLNANNQDMITEALKVARLNKISPDQLTFELTETAFLDDSNNVVQMMKGLQRQGFKTAVDDFGAGYSLLNMIANVPADTIKIDRHFLLSCEQTSRGLEFLKQLVNMIRNMGYYTLCEGIETEQQLKLLTELGCDYGQGFIFSEPVPMDEFFQQLQAPTGKN